MNICLIPTTKVLPQCITYHFHVIINRFFNFIFEKYFFCIGYLFLSLFNHAPMMKAKITLKIIANFIDFKINYHVLVEIILQKFLSF